MSTTIDILSPGYAHKQDTTENGITKKFMRATGSCCLVRSNKMNVLFDTMGPWEKDLLLEKLGALKVHPDDIEYLVCSHSHPDHVGNLNLFTKAKKHFVGMSLYTENLYDLNCFEPSGSYIFSVKREKGGDDSIGVVEYEPYALDSHLSVEPTQGHTLDCVSLIVNNCDNYGTVGLVGDLFENQDDIQDQSIWLAAGSQNPNLQRANRSRIFNKVDYILPGHGDIFKTSNKSVKMNQFIPLH